MVHSQVYSCCETFILMNGGSYSVCSNMQRPCPLATTLCGQATCDHEVVRLAASKRTAFLQPQFHQHLLASRGFGARRLEKCTHPNCQPSHLYRFFEMHLHVLDKKCWESAHPKNRDTPTITWTRRPLFYMRWRSG